MSVPATTATRPHPPAESSHAVVRALAWTARAVTVAVTTTASAVFLGGDMPT